MSKLYGRVRRLIHREIVGRPEASTSEVMRDVLGEGCRYLIERVTATAFLFRCDKVGIGARSVGCPRIVNKGTIRIGDHFGVLNSWIPTEIVAGPNGRVEIGSHVAINYGCSIFAAKGVYIGDRVRIGNLSIISDTRSAGLVRDRLCTYDQPEQIQIGHDAWLASRVTVLPGTKIGPGAVITAGSIVSGEIPADVIAGGNPARVLRRLPASVDSPSVSVTQGYADAPADIRHKSFALDPKPELRGTIVADFTANELRDHLRNTLDAPFVDVELAPFGQILQSLIQGPSPDYADFALVWTRPESAVPAFGRLLAGETVGEDELLLGVDSFCDAVTSGSKRYRYMFVPSWALAHWQRGLGMLDARAGGAIHALTIMNLRLMNRFSATPNTYVMNMQRWIDSAGRNAWSAKAWYLGKLAFSGSVFEEAVRDIKAAIRGLSGQARKLLVLDLDDLLWGGTVGDVGWENLRLGGHDPEGEAFVELQKRVKTLAKRGVVLGLVSKNTESVALEAIENHPEMVLRKTDFVGWRINWNDKAHNVVELAAELNLGLQSVVFIDDNPLERARVREALPEVLVPEWPEDVLLYPSALDSLSCFDAPTVSAEDSARTSFYIRDRERQASLVKVGDVDEWLHSLKIRVKVELLNGANRQRATQLLNKTNQMNLSTRRLTEQELLAWAASPNRRFLTFGVSDRFGESGLTGLLSLEVENDLTRIVDFVLSCRVMGRKIEHAMVHLAVEYARERKAKQVEARFIETSKNKPCHEFWIHSGFASDGERFLWNCDVPYELPSFIKVEGRPN